MFCQPYRVTCVRVCYRYKMKEKYLKKGMDTQYKIKNAGCYIRCITPVSRGSTEAAHTTYHILAAQQEPYRKV